MPADLIGTAREGLLAWFREHGRDLPWRRTRDPWAVLVAELMLQQTQVSRVVPKYAAFLERFPTAGVCVEASAGEVVRMWAGLGYNRRAVNLHRCARVCVRDHGGTLPADLGALLALPGVGPYTARAVLAFAFERDVAPLDVNTARPPARAFGARSQAAADALVPPGQGWAWSQALMDLGATVCTRRAPHCGGCPLRPVCAWHLAGHPEPDPAAPASRQSPLEGSDRQGRGRLVDALRLGPVAFEDVPVAAGWADDPGRAHRVVAGLVADGLARWDADGRLVLP